jgi:hypothetical protein
MIANRLAYLARFDPNTDQFSHDIDECLANANPTTTRFLALISLHLLTLKQH